MLAFLVDRLRPIGAYGVSVWLGVAGLLVLGAAAVGFAELAEDVLHCEGLTGKSPGEMGMPR